MSASSSSSSSLLSLSWRRVGRAWSIVGAGVAACAVALVVGCIDTQAAADLALCCTCLDQKSPQNDADAVDPTTNCLPDDREVDGCNDEAGDIVNAGAGSISVVDENCGVSTCDEECAGARVQGATFTLVEEGLS